MPKFEMEFTGERVVPEKTPQDIYVEHMDRYKFAADFTRHKDILDVACGTGYGINHLVEKETQSAIGVDSSKDAIGYAGDWFGNSRRVSFLCADGVRLPFVDNCFDVVVSFETLEHIRAYRKFLAECKRVLKNDGILICSTPNRRVFSPNLAKPLNPFHVKEFWPEEFHRLIFRYFKNVTFYGQCDVTLADNSVERRYGIREFKDDRRISSAYIIAVASNKKG